jgi:hypothetical protein
MINLPAKIDLPQEYNSMLVKIEDNLPALQKDSQAFFKSQSQFMNNMLTVSHPTPLRNLRQILAEVNKSKAALDQAYIKNKKLNIKIKMKRRDIEDTQDELKKELLEAKITGIEINIKASEEYMKGAIRKIAAYVDQYNSILKHMGKDSFTEEDFEREETRYHIGKAFEQALTAARSRGGLIDEGNHIYMLQIGINGAVAQFEVTQYLEQENELLKNGKAPTHRMTLMWINALMDKFQDDPSKYAEAKGMKLLDKESLVEGL